MMGGKMEMEGSGNLLHPSLEVVEEKEEIMPPAAPSKDRYIFRIELESFEPPIWRQFSIDADADFSDLHNAIQALFEWDGVHCHCFQIRNGRRIVSKTQGFEDPLRL